MNKITSFSIRLDIPDTDLREADISYLIDKSLRPIIDDNKFENVEIDVVDITERIEDEWKTVLETRNKPLENYE